MPAPLAYVAAIGGASVVYGTYKAVKSSGDSKDSDEEIGTSHFGSGNLDSVKSAFMSQLSKIDGLREQIDIGKVALSAGNGAKIGIKRGKITGLLGLVAYGGLEIYTQLNEGAETSPSFEDLDSDETAEDILRWQKMGKSSGYDGMELASGALGAAVSVDKQTSGREVSRVLSNLDFDMVNRQLEAGNEKNAAVELASETVDAYSTELSWLSEQKESNDDIPS
jgi:hypothetical protein